MLTTTSRAVTGATTRYQAPRRNGRSTGAFKRAQWLSPSGLFGRAARDTKSRLDERFHGREPVAAGAREMLQESGVAGPRQAGAKWGFSTKPTRLPNGAATVATRMSPPTSWTGALRVAPAAVKCRTAVSTSGTPQ